MNRTLLDTVQKILLKLDLDPVNSINDSEDAFAVAQEAETTFFDILSRDEWPDFKDLVKLESVGDLNNPTALRLSKKIEKLHSLRYDVTSATHQQTAVNRINWLEPEEFLQKIYHRNNSSDTTDTVFYKDHQLFIHNNIRPTWYTSFDNEYLILDSYDSEVETTLQGHKAICSAYVLPDWELKDSFIIPVPDNMYSLFLAELSAAASLYLNGIQSPNDEFRARTNIANMRREAIRTEAQYFPRNHYGRKGNGRA